jgi:hypothetical protein
MPVFTVSGSWVAISGSLSASTVLSGGSISGQVVWGTDTSGQVDVKTVSGSYVAVTGTITVLQSGASQSGIIVWGATGTSGEMPVITIGSDYVSVSGAVSVSGNVIFAYISGGMSGTVRWGTGTSGMDIVYTNSGYFVTVSGTVVTSVSGNTVVTSISGNAVVTSVSGNVVLISGQPVTTSVSGNTVVTSISGNTVVTSVSGNVVLISGQPVTTSVSGNTVITSVSGNVVLISGQPVTTSVSGNTVVTSVSGNTVVTSVSGNVVGISISGGSISGQSVGGLDLGGFYPQNQRLTPDSTASNPQPFTFDTQANLNVRGAVQTDEGSVRDSFNNSGNIIYRLMSSAATFTNGSTDVTFASGGNFLDNIFAIRDFVKVSGDIDNYYAGVASINSSSSITLYSNYAGTSTTSAYLLHSRFGVIQAFSGAYTVASSFINLGAGVTISGQMFIYRVVDYLPLLFNSYTIVTQRISGQDAYIGLVDNPTNPGDFARFHFTGTSNGTVNCETGFALGGGGTQLSGVYDITAASIPSSGVTNSGHYYRIEVASEEVTFMIDGFTVATNKINIPNPYTQLDFYAGWQNGGAAPASSSQLYMDFVFLNDTDSVQVTDTFYGQPIPVVVLSGAIILSGGIVNISGEVVYGVGTSGQNAVTTLSGSFVTVSGLVMSAPTAMGFVWISGVSTLSGLSTSGGVLVSASVTASGTTKYQNTALTFTSGGSMTASGVQMNVVWITAQGVSATLYSGVFLSAFGAFSYIPTTPVFLLSGDIILTRAIGLASGALSGFTYSVRSVLGT